MREGFCMSLYYFYLLFENKYFPEKIQNKMYFFIKINLYVENGECKL